MKPVIYILAVSGLGGVMGAFVDLHTIVIGYSTWSRVASLLFGSAALAGAFGCYRRAAYGWYIVEALIWISIALAIVRAVYVGWRLQLPLLGTVFGGIGEGVKILIFACVIFPFWSKQRKSFASLNEPTDSGLASGTSPAGKEGRLR